MDVVLSEPTTSREHAAIVHHADGRLFLIDLASVRAHIFHLLYRNFPVTELSEIWRLGGRWRTPAIISQCAGCFGMMAMSSLAPSSSRIRKLLHQPASN